MRRWRFWAARVGVERFRGRVRTSAAGCVEFAIQHVWCPGDAARLEAAHLLHRQRLPRSHAPVETVEVRPDQRVDACVVFHDGESAGMGEHVAGNLRPVDNPSGIAGELVEHDVLTARVHITERMNRRRLTPHPREPIGERIRIQSAEVVTGGEFTEDTLGSDVGCVDSGFSSRRECDAAYINNFKLHWRQSAQSTLATFTVILPLDPGNDR